MARNGFHSAMHDGGSNIATTDAELRDQSEQKMHEGSAALQDLLTIDRNKNGDGKGYLFGIIPISRKVEAALTPVFNVITPWLNKEGAPRVYDKTFKFAEKFETVKKYVNPHKLGLWAAGAFTALLIGTKPVMNIVQVYRQYRQEKNDLLQDWAPVIEANGGRYKDIGVIRNALQEITDRAKSGLWVVGSDLPTLVPTAVYAISAHGDLMKEKGALYAQKLQANKSQNLAVNPESSAQQVKSLNEKWAEIVEASNEITDKRIRNSFLKDQREKLLSEANREHEQHNIHQPEQTEKKNAEMMPLMIGAEVVGKVWKADIEDKQNQREEHRNASKLILHLKNNPDDFSHPSYLRQIITEIVQQNERDNGHSTVGPDLMPRLQPSINKIAEAVSEKRLSPLAIAQLLDTVIKHDKGRSFATEKQIDDAIEKLVPTIGTRETAGKDEFYSNFEDPDRAKQQVRKNIKSMEGPQKALFAALLPDDILMLEGVKKKDIIELRKTAYEDDAFYAFVAANVVHLADKNPAKLKELGLTEAASESLAMAAEEIKAGNTTAIKQLVDGEDKSLLAAIRKAGLNEQAAAGPEGEQYWAKRQQEGAEFKQSLKEEEKAREQPPRRHNPSRYEPVQEVGSRHPDMHPDMRRMAQVKPDVISRLVSEGGKGAGHAEEARRRKPKVRPQKRETHVPQTFAGDEAMPEPRRTRRIRQRAAEQEAVAQR